MSDIANFVTVDRLFGYINYVKILNEVSSSIQIEPLSILCKKYS